MKSPFSVLSEYLASLMLSIIPNIFQNCQKISEDLSRNISFITGMLR